MIDPVDYAIISQAIVAIAREMGSKLVRSAYSTIVREAKDAAAAILDRDGNIIAQAEMVPMQIGSMNTTLRACLELYPADTLCADDFLINNHPYHGGQHSQDIFIFTPIFVGEELVGFSGTSAHHLDIGGGAPGLNSAATDLYQEGLIIPPSRYSYSRDWNGGMLERLIGANIRIPEQTLGDLNAQFAANAVGVERIRQLCNKYGAGLVSAVMGQLIAYTERQLRAAIAAIPNGVYFGEDAVDDDGIGDEPLWIRAKVTIAGDEIEIDYDGTCPQVVRNINSPFASTASAALSCIKGVLLGPDVPFNEGGFRPVTVKAPLGSLLNPRPPAPVRARMEPCYRAYDAVMKALGQAVPERVIAPGFNATLITCLTRFSEGRFRVCLEVYGGGFGAAPTADGADGIAQPLSNTNNTPIETLDMEFDFFRIVSYGLADDSAGAGKFRGGLGIRREYEILRDDTNLTIYADRLRIAPEGLGGGRPGERARCEIIRDGRRLDVDARHGVMLRTGDRVVVTTAGGGGYGNPRDRPAHLINRDVRQLFLSPQQAFDLYGWLEESKGGSLRHATNP